MILFYFEKTLLFEKKFLYYDCLRENKFHSVYGIWVAEILLQTKR